MQHKVVKRLSVINAITILVAIVAPFFAAQDAKAANLQQAYVRLDRVKAAMPTSGLVCAKPATTSTATNIDVAVTFPSAFSAGVSTTVGNWAATTAGIPTGTTAWPGITTATVTVAAPKVTWTYTVQTLTAGTTYCFNWTNTAALTNPVLGTYTDGKIETHDSGPTLKDSANIALAVISEDQITVNATVPPSFALTFTGGSDNFVSNLSGTTTSTTGKTAQVVTNAANGWTIWVKSANAALNTAGATIPTYGTVNGTPDDIAGLPATASYYVLDADKTTDSATAGTGVVTIAGEYDGGNTTSGGTLSTSFQPVASASGVTDGDTITLIERARVSAIQKAANDYTDTLTVVAAGLF